MTKKEFLKRIDDVIKLVNYYGFYSCVALHEWFPVNDEDYCYVRDIYYHLFNDLRCELWLDRYIYDEQSKWTPREVRIFFITMFAEWCLVHKEYRRF